MDHPIERIDPDGTTRRYQLVTTTVERLEAVLCTSCGEWFGAKRANARTCSDACRTRASRERAARASLGCSNPNT